jgi:hypothetical protein
VIAATPQIVWRVRLWAKILIGASVAAGVLLVGFYIRLEFQLAGLMSIASPH